MRTILVGLGLVGACGSIGAAPDAAIHDARPIDSVTDSLIPACDVTKPFGAPVQVPGVNDAGDTAWGWLSSDELTIYYNNAISTYLGVYTATRTDTTSAFAGNAPLAGVTSGTDNVSRPVLTANGLTLFATITSAGNTKMNVATRGTALADFGGLSPVSALDDASGTFDGDPWVSEDGKIIYIATLRTTGVGSYDIFYATLSNAGTFNPPVPESALDTAGIEDAPVRSKDGLEIFFASPRAADSMGRNDIWHATRSATTDGFGAPTRIDELSTAVSEEYPNWLSPDRCRLMFTSDRAEGSMGGYDLWMATRPM